MQNKYRDIFAPFMKTSNLERKRATHLRRLLVENGIEYHHVKEGYGKGGREELENILNTKVLETCSFFCLNNIWMVIKS